MGGWWSWCWWLGGWCGCRDPRDDTFQQRPHLRVHTSQLTLLNVRQYRGHRRLLRSPIWDWWLHCRSCRQHRAVRQITVGCVIVRILHLRVCAVDNWCAVPFAEVLLEWSTVSVDARNDSRCALHCWYRNRRIWNVEIEHRIYRWSVVRLYIGRVQRQRLAFHVAQAGVGNLSCGFHLLPQKRCQEVVNCLRRSAFLDKAR